MPHVLNNNTTDMTEFTTKTIATPTKKQDMQTVTNNNEQHCFYLVMFFIYIILHFVDR